MKVVVNFFGKVVFDIALLPAISEAVIVDSEGYGKNAKYLPKDDVLDFEIIRDGQLVTSEEETAHILRSRLEAKEEERCTASSKAYNLENENKKLKEEIEKLKALCPHTEKKDDSPKPTQEEKPF